jgi:hypothetical protein
MKRNEKILAAVLGLFVVGYLGWPMVRATFIDPVTELESKVDGLRSTIASQKQTQFEIHNAARELGTVRGRGLPGSDLDAQRLYQQWLNELALASGLEVAVTPVQRIYSGAGVYSGVQVNLDGKATFDELQTFLSRFRRADLLHRVASLKVTSPAAEGDPNLEIKLVAEGLNLKGTPARSRLFPQIELTEALPADRDELTLPSKEFAAESGDLLRIGNEFAIVTDVTGDRVRVKRGIEGTAAVEHPNGTRVELLPVRKPGPKEPPIVIAEIDNPFVKPRKYDPRFDGFADTKLVRGDAAKMTVKVADYDRSAGAPKIELVSGPDGLAFDAATGNISWSPAKDLPAGPYKLTLAANVPAPEKRIEQTVTITLAEPNTAPTLGPIASTEIFLGETLRIPLKAEDPDGGTLDYKIEGVEGASVDGDELRWPVPESFNPGEVTLTVTASDKGDPPLSAKQTVAVKVRENLKPFVFLVASIADEANRYAWLYDRSSNRRLTLREGQSFEAAGVTATTREIGRDFVIYERNGETWKLRLGRHLGQAEKVGEAVASARSNAAPVEANRPRPATPTAGETPSTAADNRQPAS